MVARRIRGESILVPIAGTMEELSCIISLNESAEFIRAKAGDGMDEASIARAVTEEYDIELERAVQDVKAVLAELEQIGALKQRTPS